MLQNPCKTLGFKKNMVYKIPPGGGGKPYPASGLFLSSSEHMLPIKFTDTIQNKLKIHVAFNNNLDKNRAYAIFAKPKYGMFMLHFCKYYTNQTIRKYNKK